MAQRTFNKSQAIREVNRETGLKGKELAVELQKRHPDKFGKRKTATLATYVYSILSSKKSKKSKSAAVSSNGMAAAPKASRSTGAPLIDQLRSLAGMIGKDGIKKLVDGL
jgi:hypothetical protein